MKIPPHDQTFAATAPAHLLDNDVQEPRMTVEEITRSKDLCAALSDMSASVRQLLGVLRRHNCITAIPDASLHEYAQAMLALAATVAKANALTLDVEQKSRDTLDSLPPMVMLRQ